MNYFVLFLAASAIVATAADTAQSVEVANDQVPNHLADITEVQSDDAADDNEYDVDDDTDDADDDADDAMVQSDAVSATHQPSKYPTNLTKEDIQYNVQLMEKMVRCFKRCPKKKSSVCMISKKGRKYTARDACGISCVGLSWAVLYKGRCQKPKPSPLKQCLMKAPKNDQPLCIGTLELKFTVKNLGVYQCWKQHRSAQLYAKGRCQRPDKLAMCLLRCPDPKKEDVRVCANSKRGKKPVTLRLCNYRCLHRHSSWGYTKVGKC